MAAPTPNRRAPCHTNSNARPRLLTIPALRTALASSECVNPVLTICERVAEVPALLHDHIECGKHSAADVAAKAQTVLSESVLLRAMFDVGYFPPNTPPPDRNLI
jgi:hypothetical protein